MSEQNATGSPVLDLIRQREQLNQWIARLDEVGAQASDRVAQRVRGDYADRLRRVNEDLATHRDEIEADLEHHRDALSDAEMRRAEAADALEEHRLRHLIGELAAPAWEAQRPALERAVAQADEAVVHAHGEVERLRALAADIAGAARAGVPEPPSTEPEPVAAEALAPDDEEIAEEEPAFLEPEPVVAEAPPAPAADPVAAADAAGSDEWDPFGGEFAAPQQMGDAEEDLPWLEGIDEAAKGWTPPAAEDNGLDFLREIEESAATPSEPAAADLGADDLAFLEELDRAIGAPAPAPRTPASPPPAASSSGPSQGGGRNGRAEPLLCKECGAINEPHAWYCEICGSEL